MQKMVKRIAQLVKMGSLTVLASAPLMMTNGLVWAETSTSILPGDWGIEDILGLVLNIVIYGLGVAAVLGVVIAGIMYLTARDNEQQVAKAKTRLLEVVIGLVAWALMYVVLRWLIPGFNPSNIPS